jgi:hypothetical protein
MTTEEALFTIYAKCYTFARTHDGVIGCPFNDDGPREVAASLIGVRDGKNMAQPLGKTALILEIEKVLT